MASYRFLNPAPVFFDLLGLSPIAGGSLAFFDQGTSDPKDTWSNEGLTVLNENPVPLDSSGRSNTSIFLDGAYTVVCKNAAGETIWTRDVYPGGDAALTIPSPTAGYFLTSPDGVNLAWSEIFQMPDPTGSTNQFPVTDGSGYVLTNVPTMPVPPDPEIVVTDSPNKSFRAGVSDDPTKFYAQFGTGSAPASGTENTQVSVTFPEPFETAPWHISIEQTHNGVTALGTVPQYCITARSASGFTVRFSTDENSDFSGWNITSAVPFTYAAFGTKEVEVEE